MFAPGFDLVVLVCITVVRDVVPVDVQLFDAVVCGGGRDVLGRVVVVVLGRDELVALFREPLLAEEPEFLDLLLVPAARPRICPRVLNMVLEVELPAVRHESSSALRSIRCYQLWCADRCAKLSCRHPLMLCSDLNDASHQ